MTHPFRKAGRLVCGAALAALLVIAPPASATVTSTIFIKWDAQDGSHSEPTNLSQVSATGRVTLEKDNYSDPSRMQGGTALADSDYGMLKSRSFAASFVNATSAGIVTQAFASSLSDWQDQVVFKAAGVSSTASGTAHATILIGGGGVTFTGVTTGPSGSLSTDSQARFTLSTASPTPLFDLDMRTACDMSACPWLSYTRVNGADVSRFQGLYSVDIPISFSPFGTTIEARLTTLASFVTTNAAVGFADADLAHSIYWGGISSVELSDGTVITDFSALGASGHDYRLSSIPASVPEPPPSTLLAAGLGLVLLARRRQVT